MPVLVRDSERESDLGTPPFGFSFLLGTLVPFVRVSQVAYIEIFNSIFKRESFLEVRPGSTKNNMPTEKNTCGFWSFTVPWSMPQVKFSVAREEPAQTRLGIFGDLGAKPQWPGT